jgi:hypothetical protein
VLIYRSVIAAKSKRWAFACDTLCLTKTKVLFYPYQFPTFQSTYLSLSVLHCSLYFVTDISCNTDISVRCCQMLFPPPLFSSSLSLFNARKTSLTRLPYRLLRVRTLNFQQIFTKFSVTVVATTRDPPHPRFFFFTSCKRN